MTPAPNTDRKARISNEWSPGAALNDESRLVDAPRQRPVLLHHVAPELRDRLMSVGNVSNGAGPNASMSRKCCGGSSTQSTVRHRSGSIACSTMKPRCFWK
jgi:hypothetical protein